MKFRYFLAAAAAALVSVGDGFAAPRHGTFADHVELHDAIQSRKVPVLKNHYTCKEQGGGYYGPVRSVRRIAIVVCQDAGEKGGEQVDWSENDLDTLRHEAWHLLQDCLDNTIDLDLKRVWTTEAQLREMAAKYDLSYKRLFAYVQNSYGERGKHVVLLEVEAHAVAYGAKAKVLAKMVKSHCPIQTTN